MPSIIGTPPAVTADVALSVFLSLRVRGPNLADLKRISNSNRNSPGDVGTFIENVMSRAPTKQVLTVS